MKEDNLIWVAERDGRIEGVVEFKNGRHVAMLFVETSIQRKGVGRKLLLTALNYARGAIVTVNASLSSVPAYRKYGFNCKGDVSASEGLVYQPMEIELRKLSQQGA